MRGRIRHSGTRLFQISQRFSGGRVAEVKSAAIPKRSLSGVAVTELTYFLPEHGQRPTVLALLSTRASPLRRLMVGRKRSRAARPPLAIHSISQSPLGPLALTRSWFPVPMADQASRRPEETRTRQSLWLTLSLQPPDHERRRAECGARCLEVEQRADGEQVRFRQMRWRARVALGQLASRRPECGAPAYEPPVRADH